MTRAIDRLIVSGAIDPERAADRDDADRLGARPARRRTTRSSRPARRRSSSSAGRRASSSRSNRFAPAESTSCGPPSADAGCSTSCSSHSSTSCRRAVPRLGIELPPLADDPGAAACTTSAASRTARSRSSSAARTATSPSACSACRRARVPRSGERRGAGLAATELGDAVHRLLELVPLDAPIAPPREELERAVRAWYPDVSTEELERIAELVDAYCRSALARRVAGLAARARSVRSRSSTTACSSAAGSTSSGARATRALVVDYKSNALEGARPAEIIEAEYPLQRLVYALVCLRARRERGRGRVPVPRAAGRRRVDDVHASRTYPPSRHELSAAIARIRAGEFRPTPSEFACSDCPALDLVCAGPRLASAR